MKISYQDSKKLYDTINSIISDKFKKQDKIVTVIATADSVAPNNVLVKEPNSDEIYNIPNLSGCNVTLNDTLLVVARRGSMYNAYVDKNVTHPPFGIN